MKPFQFTKMQGLGNDFVVVEGPARFERQETAEICDRRFGVGADGLLVLTEGDPLVMDYWNADGSPAEMCGNGLRCVARYAYDRGWVGGAEFTVMTPAGPRGVRLSGEEVDAEIGPARVGGHTTIDGRRYHLVDVGNPHAVLVVDDPDKVDVDLVGPHVERHETFPEGTNVEFITVSDGRVRMRVWERGVGETLACGTGMVAAAFVATKTDRLEPPIEVDTPGGSGVVEFRDGSAWLRGPAGYSFTGIFEAR